VNGVPRVISMSDPAFWHAVAVSEPDRQEGTAQGAVRALEECRSLLERAKEAGRNTSAAERLLGTAEVFIRSGNHRIGTTYIRKATEALGERPVEDER
jgi:hypothetical protein